MSDDEIDGRLYQREREFATLVDNAPDIIARLDLALRFIYINRAVEPALGTDPKLFAGRTGEELGLPPAMVAAVTGAAMTAMASGEEESAVFNVINAQDSQHFCARLIPERDRDGVIESILMVIYDITARTRAQQECDRLLAAERAARERAEAAAQSRDQFLAIVSHELRSPLNGIQSWSNVLEAQLPDDAPALMRRALTGIKTGVSQQVHLIEDLLDATRIMSGTLSLSSELVGIRAAVEAAIESLSAAAATRHIELVTDLRLEEHQTVRGDPDRLRQIAWNLLANAVKFTPEHGSITVSLLGAGGRARLIVSDTGKGIAADFLPYLFEWFGRDETSSRRNQDGIGLGLALVRHLCELHGGQVSATSPGPGKGATFEVQLPLAMELDDRAAPSRDTAAEARRRVPSIKNLRVMVIDDQQEAREALSALLSGMQAQVSAFASGQAALSWMRAQGRQRCADVLVCDLAMPGEDGYATLARVHAFEREIGRAPPERLRAIALSAFAQREERERALTAGFDLHLAKPASAEDLAGAIAELARAAG